MNEVKIEIKTHNTDGFGTAELTAAAINEHGEEIANLFFDIDVQQPLKIDEIIQELSAS